MINVISANQPLEYYPVLLMSLTHCYGRYFTTTTAVIAYEYFTFIFTNVSVAQFSKFSLIVVCYELPCSMFTNLFVTFLWCAPSSYYVCVLVRGCI